MRFFLPFMMCFFVALNSPRPALADDLKDTFIDTCIEGEKYHEYNADEDDAWAGVSEDVTGKTGGNSGPAEKPPFDEGAAREKCTCVEAFMSQALDARTYQFAMYSVFGDPEKIDLHGMQVSIDEFAKMTAESFSVHAQAEDGCQ